MVKLLKDYCAARVDKELMPTALKVAAVVGSLLFLINHGTALVQGKMTRDRWISGFLTNCLIYNSANVICHQS